MLTSSTKAISSIWCLGLESSTVFQLQLVPGNFHYWNAALLYDVLNVCNYVLRFHGVPALNEIVHRVGLK